MSIKAIDGKLYSRMLFGGTALLAEHTDELNALNVFPVSDGDTGTNMLKTMEGGLSELEKSNETGIGRLSELFARGVLLAARGNSGVILSQIFAGINEGLENHDAVTAPELAKAYQNGIIKSYAAVQDPTEGTILTVFRESTDYAAENITEESTIDDFFRLHVEQARRSLAATKELLPVLAEADVVDSGAAGYLYIAEGMYNTLNGTAVSYQYSRQEEKNAVNIDLFTRDSVLEYGYCTEFLLRLTTSKVDPDSFKIDTVISMLTDLGGESIVAYKQDDIVKVHVHTFNPGEILSHAQAFGEFLTIKIENMAIGHSQAHIGRPAKPKKLKKHRSDRKFSLVSVAQGEGISALFEKMGVDQIINGGQTSNPSIEDFVSAFKECDTKEIIVFPNNKNSLLVAKQAAALYKEANIYIIETKNLMQGFSALSVITPGLNDMEALRMSAQRAAQDVIDGEITKAIRDAYVDGFTIKKGDYIAISKGNIAAVADTAEAAVSRMLEATDMDMCEIITVFAGKDVSESRRAKLAEELQKTYDDCEVVVYDGGQEVYDYFLAIE